MGEHDVFSSRFAFDVFLQKYSMDKKEGWRDLAKRVAWSVCQGQLKDDEIKVIESLIYERKFIPGGRYLYSAGRPYHAISNCYAFRAIDSREGWASTMSKTVAASMGGGGLGVNYTPVRPFGYPLKRTGGFAGGPIGHAHMVNEGGRYIAQGGSRRVALWGGLAWWHPDVLPRTISTGETHPGWLYLKDWSEALREAKARDLTFPLPMELTNISICYDTLFFDLLDGKYESKGNKAVVHAPWGDVEVTKELAEKIWHENCSQAFRTAEPGFSLDYERPGEDLRNACTEFISPDSDDRCNLGTVWLNHIQSLDELSQVTHFATLFLLAGGVYSHYPTKEIEEVSKRNNRIGLGLGGLHEWLMARGYPFKVTDELHEWLSTWRSVNDRACEEGAAKLRVAFPKGRRAVAPVGTLGIMAESTTGIEPLYCKAYERKYFSDGRWKFQYVVDQSVQRLLAIGVPLEKIQDSYDLRFEERVAFQAGVQDYTDMGISSTCNMPQWGTEVNNENTAIEYEKILLKFAKRLRGFTCYPDGARGGQPLRRVEDLDFALQMEGKVFEARQHECVGGVCGI